MRTIHDRPTADSIADARAAQIAERADVYARTGLRIMGNGHITQPATIILCPRPGCTFAASARSEGRAVQALGTHLVQVHIKETV